MKNALLTLILFLLTISTNMAQETIPEYTKTVDGIIERLYASISGEKGEPRDWDSFDKLFIPEAKLIPTGNGESGDKSYTVSSPSEYKERANQYLVENGFYEVEINRVQESYGPIVHMFSTYISKRSINDPEPFNRGINSIQLFNDGERWWIVSIYWAHEPDNSPLPKEYLPKGD